MPSSMTAPAGPSPTPVRGSAATPSPGGLTRMEWGAVGVLVAVALALRLRHLGDGLWYDEIQTLVDYVRLPFGDLISTYDSKNQHPFFSVLAHGSFALFGESAWALRLPAALFGALGPVAVYLLGRYVVAREEAFTAAALLAVSSHHIWFSQNARGYTGLMFLATISTLAFLRLLQAREAGRGTVALYAVASALALYTHMTAAFQLAAHGLVWLVARRQAPDGGRRAFVAMVLGGLGGVLLYLPVLQSLAPTLLATVRPAAAGPSAAAAASQVAWKSPWWLVTETLGVLSRGVPGGYLGLAVVAGIGVAGLVRYARERPLALALFVVPGVVTVVAILALRHNLWPRFFFFLTGFILLVGVRGWFWVASLAGRWARPVQLAGATVAVLALSGTATRAWGPKQQYEEAVAFVEATLAPGDSAATVDLTNYPVHAWLGRAWPVLRTESDLAGLEARSRRTLVLTTFPVRLLAEAPAVAARLAARYDTVRVFPGTVNGGDIVVLGSRRGEGE